MYSNRFSATAQCGEISPCLVDTSQTFTSKTIHLLIPLTCSFPSVLEQFFHTFAGISFKLLFLPVFVSGIRITYLTSLVTSFIRPVVC